MSDSKRTRSQLTLPEEFQDVHFGVSPLRAARQERKRHLQTHSPPGSSQSPAPDARVPADASDDELLLSPPKLRTPKRPPLSEQPGPSPEEIDPERQCKRLKQDHDDERSHVAATETRPPSGPFDFSAIDPKLLLPSSDLLQPVTSPKPRAHTVPLASPTIRRRDLGQLMPSFGKAPIVPPERDILRFSSLPRSLEPLTESMDVDILAKFSKGSEDDGIPARSPTPPPPSELGGSSPCRISATEVKSLPCPNEQLPSVESGLVVIASNVSPQPSTSDLPAVTPQISSKLPDNDITPKPINPPLTLTLDVNPIPSAPGGPSSLSDDPPSPLSALSSLSEFDHSSLPHDSEVHIPNIEPPIPQAAPPPSFVPSCSAIDSALPQVTRMPVTPSRSKGGRGSAKLSSSARLTRSSSVKKQTEEGSVRGNINTKSSIPAKRPLASPALLPDFKKKSSSVAVSHKKASSFAIPTSSSLSRTVEKVPASSPAKSSSLPRRQLPKLLSPMKRASSLGPGEPSHPSKHTGLSNLSLALEKLKIPPPSRPATTLGFNSDARFSSNALDPQSASKAKDDSGIRLGNGLPSSSKATAIPLRRVVTIGSVASSGPSAHASGSKPAALVVPRLAHPTDAGPPAKKINLHSGIIVGKSSTGKPGVFMYGGVGKKRAFEKVSKKSSLPVVEASPVKESGNSRAMSLGEPPLQSTSGILAATSTPHKDAGQAEAPTALAAIEPMDLKEAFADRGSEPGVDNTSTEDGRAEAADIWKHASRRASLASQFLQQTLAVLPSTPPPRASGSKSKAAERPQKSSQSTRSGLRSGGSDVVGSRGASIALSKGHAVGAHLSKPGLTGTASSSSLKVLKSCTIFVDVRTDDGDDAGGLFVDMLKGLGAKIIGRAGQSCTHIVYKNGLMSTLTKYRLMREPKPFVVGISWVVECAEQCRRVGEENFLVDLEGLNVAGNNKRRRSMLPKHISSSLQTHTTVPSSLPGSSVTATLASDQSMEESSVGADLSLKSSDGPVEEEDDLPPLERARQRRNLLFKS